MIDDKQIILDLIRALRDALSLADTAATEVNRRLIQAATEVLEKYGADRPHFE
jgi:hypothetical protein